MSISYPSAFGCMRTRRLLTLDASRLEEHPRSIDLGLRPEELRLGSGFGPDEARLRPGCP